jgi:hypothetical protein
MTDDSHMVERRYKAELLLKRWRKVFVMSRSTPGLWISKLFWCEFVGSKNRIQDRFVCSIVGMRT